VANISELRAPEATIAGALPDKAGNLNVDLQGPGAQAVRQAKLEADLREQGGRGVIESLAAHVSQRKVDSALDNNIGTTIGPDGKKVLNAREDAHLKRAQRIEKLNLAVGEGNFDNLGTREKGNVLARVETMFIKSPQLRRILDGFGATGTTDREQFLTQIVKTEAFAKAVREIHGDKLDAEVADSELAQLRQDYGDKEAAFNAKRGEILNIGAQQSILEAVIKEQTGYDLSGFDPKTKQDNLNANVKDREDVRTSDRAAAEKMDRYKQMRDEKARLEATAKVTADPSEKRRIRAEARRLNTQITTITGTPFTTNEQKYLHAIDTLDRNHLADQQRQLQESEEIAQDQLRTLQSEGSAAGLKVRIAEHRRNAQEENYVNGLDDVIAEASVTYLDKELKKADEVRQAEIKRLGDENKDTNKAQVLQLLSTRWHTRQPSGLFRRQMDRVNRNNVNTDFELLLSQGPRALMDSLIPTGIGGDQRNEMLNDTEMQGQFLGTLLQNRMENGGLNTVQIRRIIGTTWGGAAIDQALKQNTEANAKIQKIREAHLMPNGLMDWLSRKNDRQLLGIIAAILGGIGVGAASGIAIAGLAGAEAATGAYAGAAVGGAGGTVGAALINRAA
jgi:hypothetical protein